MRVAVRWEPNKPCRMSQSHSAKASTSTHSGRQLALARSPDMHRRPGEFNTPTAVWSRRPIAVGAVAHIDDHGLWRKSRTQAGLLTKLTTLARQDQCAPTTFDSPVIPTSQLPARQGGFTAICDCRKTVARSRRLASAGTLVAPGPQRGFFLGRRATYVRSRTDKQCRLVAQYVIVDL